MGLKNIFVIRKQLGIIKGLYLSLAFLLSLKESFLLLYIFLFRGNKVLASCVSASSLLLPRSKAGHGELGHLFKLQHWHIRRCLFILEELGSC